jgi:hypothetical protein
MQPAHGVLRPPPSGVAAALPPLASLLPPAAPARLAVANYIVKCHFNRWDWGTLWQRWMVRYKRMTGEINEGMRGKKGMAR